MSRRVIKDVSFVGMPIGIKRRVLETVATVEELKDFRDKCTQSKELNVEICGLNWDESQTKRGKRYATQSKKRYYRQLWRARYCAQMKPGLYKTCKKFKFYDYHDTLSGGEGLMQNYWGSNTKEYLPKNSLLMFSHHDEIGNVHFVTCNHNRTVAFKRAGSQVDFLERVADV